MIGICEYSISDITVMTTLMNYLQVLIIYLILSASIFVYNEPLDSMESSLVLLVTWHTTTLMTVPAKICIKY